MKFTLIEVALNKDLAQHWKIKKKKESQNVMNQQYCYWRSAVAETSFFSFLADLAKVADCSDYVVDCLILLYIYVTTLHLILQCSSNK